MAPYLVGPIPGVVPFTQYLVALMHRTITRLTGSLTRSTSPVIIPALRVRFLAAVVVFLLAGQFSAADEASTGSSKNLDGSGRPNVVIVMTDDQGYGDLSCHGNPILKTPNLDQLHSQSLRLVDYHVSPTCSPTRAAFLTGHWTNRAGAWHTIAGRSLLRADETTLADLFQSAGYTTGMFGKWHLGDNYPFRPTDRGFDEVMCHGGGGVGQTPDFWNNAYFDGTYFHNNEPTPVNGFCTDVFFDYATEFITESIEEDKPFLAYVATNAAHGPMHSPPEDAAPYQELGTNVANFFGMIANLDRNVGELRELLEEKGAAENTIFIYTTDNGTAAGGKVFNSGMKGFKGSPYEGGHRVPFFVHWPAGNLAPAADIETLTAHVDVVPTLLDLCGVGAPEQLKFDGTSLAAILRGESVAELDERLLITDSQRVLMPEKWRNSSVMSSQYRLVNRKELYDLTSDPGQQNNVASDHPEVVEKMRRFYDSWWSELEPSFAEFESIVLGHPAENPVRLTCHDWLTAGATPWNQASIRKSAKPKKNFGFWSVDVVEAGQYTVSLRRWPAETGVAIDASIPPGDPVPGANAYRTTPGKALPITSASLMIADVNESLSVTPGQQQAVFTVTLPQGQAELRAAFQTDDGDNHGAYYVSVEKL